MQKLLGIDNIMYRVKDLDSASRFYEQVLGLKKAWTDTERQMVGFVFEQGGGELVIHTDTSISNPDWSFLVENVEKFVEAFRNKGYAVVSEIIEVRCGNYAVLSDLDGNKIPIIDLTKFGGKPQYD